jgi:hypothetical protein
MAYSFGLGPTPGFALLGPARGIQRKPRMTNF